MLDVRELAWWTEGQIRQHDIAELNLACAAGLPGSEKIDKEECIDRLNQAAGKALVYTERKMPEFHANPRPYDGSENKFRVACMIRFLQEIYGIRYNPAKIPLDVPFFVEDSFIHGALMGEGGTCASLPVVYVAVGRRMCYPLKLVSCRGHQFFRWDETGSGRFNVEVNNTSAGSQPDDHYRQGVFECNPEMEKECCFLVSKTPKMELASFLAQRGHCWKQEKNYLKAAEAFFWAAAQAPENKQYLGCFHMAINDWKDQLDEKTPAGFPEVAVRLPSGKRRFPSTTPLDDEHHFLVVEAKHKLMQQQQMKNWCAWVERLNGERPAWMPPMIEVEVPNDRWRFEP